MARPLTGTDLDSLRVAASTRDADVIVVAPTGATPDALPATVLRRCLDAVLPSGCTVADVPLEWRSDAADPALALAAAAAFDGTALWFARSAARPAGDGTTPPPGDIELVPGPAIGDVLWWRLLDSLQAATTTESAVPADDPELARVLPLLRRWRPPRRHRGLVVLLTGLSGSGKSTLARGLVQHLLAGTDRTVTLLDGDVVRRMLSSGLGFDAEARDLNVRRIGFVAAEIARHGGIAVCAPIAPYAESRAAVREMVEAVGDLVLVHVATPLAECERRDVKGLYAKARAGAVGQFTGISDRYDEPADADLRIDTSHAQPGESLSVLIDHLRAGGWITPAGH